MTRTPQGLFLQLVFLLFSLGTMVAQARTIQFPNPIKHLVVVFQENRTPDNLFQGLCSPPFGTASSCSTTPSATQYNIASKNWLDKHSLSGVTQPGPVPLGNTYDLSHAHSAFIKMRLMGYTATDKPSWGIYAVGASPRDK